MIKSILQTRDIVLDNQKEEERRRILWGLSYVQFEKKYNLNLREGKINSQKRIANFLNNGNKKNDHQLEKVNQFWLQFSLNYTDTPNKKTLNQEIFLSALRNVVSCNISKLSQLVNVQVLYYLTNKNIRVLCPSSGLPHECVSLK